MLLKATLKKKSKKKAAAAAAAAIAESPEAALGVAETKTPEDDTRDYTYTELLERVYKLIRERNPEYESRKRQILPTPDISKVGSRRTMWSNFYQTTQILHRSPDHVMAFVLAELGTEGSLDQNNHLVVKGRYVAKQFEQLLKKYIVDYVTCNMCRNPDTTLTRDSVTRLHFVQCESCNSRRSVQPIKGGFHATTRGDRRKIQN